jgi:hypothetical protein
LAAPIRTVFGEVPVQRCIRERNVLGHLPERDRPTVKARDLAEQRRAVRTNSQEDARTPVTVQPSHRDRRREIP